MSIAAFAIASQAWEAFTLTRVSPQSEENQSPDVTPLPVVILGTPESVQRIQLAVDAGATFGLVKGRPLYVAGVFSRGSLKSFDPKESDSACRPAGLVKSFVENSLSIANRMSERRRPQGIRRSTQWLAAFVEYCGIEHALWAAPEQSDPETDLLFRESAQVFKHVWPAVIPAQVAAEFSNGRR